MLLIDQFLKKIWNIITILNKCFLCEYIVNCHLFLWIFSIITPVLSVTWSVQPILLTRAVTVALMQFTYCFNHKTIAYLYTGLDIKKYIFKKLFITKTTIKYCKIRYSNSMNLPWSLVNSCGLSWNLNLYIYILYQKRRIEKEQNKFVKDKAVFVIHSARFTDVKGFQLWMTHVYLSN